MRGDHSDGTLVLEQPSSGLAVQGAARPRTVERRARRWLFRGCCLALAGCVGLAVLEAGLRLTRDRDRFYPYHPSYKRVFYPSPEQTPGIEGVSYFTTCSLGTRGPEPDDSRYRLLVIGGSTAACTALNDDETWPYLLARYVNEQCGNQTLWVTNSGVDGLNSRHHLMHARYLVPNIPRLNYVIIYAGLNDVGLWLYQTHFDPDYLSDPENWARTVAKSFRLCNYAAPEAPWHKHFEIWKRASAVKATYQTARATAQQREGLIVQDERFEWLERERRERVEREKACVHRAKMETLDTALRAYRKNLSSIIAHCRQSGAEPILVAQYLKWHGLTEEERRRLWMGAMDGGATYVHEDEMGRLVATFNEAMRQVAADESVPFVDLPALLDGERDLVYDGSHFNEKGARCVAAALTTYLIDVGTFGRS